MNISPVRFHSAEILTGSGGTITTTVATANVAIGNVLIVWLGFLNLTTTTPTVSGLSKMAGETNSWVKIASHDSPTAGAASGPRGEMWAIRTTVAWTVGTSVTATLSAAAEGKIMQLVEFSGCSVNVRGSAGTGVSLAGTPSASTSGVAVVAGDLVLGATAGRTSSSVIGVSHGAWSGTGSGSWGNSNAVNMAVCLQHQSFTFAGPQTYDPTFTGSVFGSGAVVVALMPQNSAPNASTLTSPATGTSIDRAVTQRLGWTFSDPDPGDSQSKFDLQYRLGAGAWTAITGTTPNTFWDAAPGTFAAGSYEWQARTYDAIGFVGPWSASSFFTAGDTPGVPSITAPISGSTIGASSATLTWSVPSQTNYQVRRVADAAGAADTATVYYDSLDVVDTSTRSVTVAFPVNSRWEHLQVRVKTAGLWSSWADCRVQVSYTPPMAPTIVATTDPSTATIRVAVTNPAPTGGAPVTSYNDIYVSSPLDPEYRAASLVAPNSTWVWWTPAAARAYTIRAVAVGSNGTTASQVLDTVVVDGGAPTTIYTTIHDGGTP